MDNLFNQKQMIKIHYAEKNESNIDEFVEHLIQFSKDNTMNISTYTFLSDTSLNIFSTNIKEDPFIRLQSGSLPLDNTFIANKKIEDSESQSGTFAFPLSNWDVYVYDFNHIYNVGVGNRFYISDSDGKIIDDFVKEFSSYGEITVIDEDINSLLFINRTLVMLTIFSFATFVIGLSFYLIQNRKRIFLNELWGYSKLKSMLAIPKLFTKTVLIYMSLLLLVFGLSIWLLDQTPFLKDYLVVFLFVNILTLLLLFLFVLLGTWFISTFSQSTFLIKGRLPFGKIQWISVILKTAVTIILFTFVSWSIHTFVQMNHKVKSLDYWDQALNIFRIEVGGVEEEVLNDLELDKDLNDRLSLFYQEIKQNNQAILMHSDNFMVIGGSSEKPTYFYTQNSNKDDEIYSPYGRSIIINENYLKFNPIKSNNGKTINEPLTTNENILTILVPEQYEYLEDKIISHYREWFYFQKVEVENIYNEGLGTPLNKQEIDELDIHIIYTKANQHYFTYNSYTGDEKNSITDPIAIIYNESLDTSNISAFVTSSVYLYDDSNGKAYEHILPSINKSNANEIRSVVSIYDEANDEIIKYKWFLAQQAIALISLVIFSSILFSVFIWSYFNASRYRLSVKYLFGYSFWRRTRRILFVGAVVNILSGLIAGCLIHQFDYIWITVAIVTFYEWSLIATLGTHLDKSNISKVIKGDK